MCGWGPVEVNFAFGAICTFWELAMSMCEEDWSGNSQFMWLKYRKRHSPPDNTTPKISTKASVWSELKGLPGLSNGTKPINSQKIKARAPNADPVCIASSIYQLAVGNSHHSQGGLTTCMYKYKHQQCATPFYSTLQCHSHPVWTATTPALAPIPGMCLCQNAQSVTVRTNSHIGTGMVFHTKTYQNCVNDPWAYLLKICQYHKKMVSKCSYHLLDVSMTHTRRNINIWKWSRWRHVSNWVGSQMGTL